MFFEIALLSADLRMYICRACVLYSDNTMHNTAEVADDLSKCCIKDVEQQPVDRSSAILPMTRLPLQAPQNMQGLMTIVFYTDFIDYNVILV
jgi:hypothetical protein